MTAKKASISNSKGGVGKTTTTTTLGHALALRGKRTLIVDFDPQGQCATALGLNPEPCVFNLLISPASGSSHRWVRETGRENLDLIPGDRSTATAQIVLNAENRPISAVAEALASLSKEYDYILFDTAPSAGGLQERAIWASNQVIIPAATEFLSMDGIQQMAQLLADLNNQRAWQGTLLGVLPTFYETVTKHSKVAMLSLKGTFGERLLPPIRRSTVLRECAAEGLTIWEKDPDCSVAADYTRLVNILIKNRR
ncbi:MAG: ParA family protein [Chloroflexi bacterium]|nr:ParA family protein [Chloroflexota bacterium]